MFLIVKAFATGIQINKFSILYIVNKRHDITEHNNQQL